MRLGLMFERKDGFPWRADDPRDLNSELLNETEENDLLSGLRDAGHDVLRLGDVRRLIARPGYWRNRVDLVINRAVGYRGIERKSLAPAVLDAAGIAYLGSTPYVLTLTRHKLHAKLVVAHAGVPTPDAALVTERGSTGLEAIAYPAIVKPIAESSSIGIGPDSVVRDAAAARAVAERIVREYAQPAIVESFVVGAEIEVPLLVDPVPRALGVIAITLHGKQMNEQFLSSDDVYGDGYGFAPPPPYVEIDRVKDAAVRAAAALGIRDYGRMDFRVSHDGTPWFIEASTHPHVQVHSGFYEAGRRRGLLYHEMLDELVTVAAQRVGLS
jgi:D-alanine-D-alanine ligase